MVPDKVSIHSAWVPVSAAAGTVVPLVLVLLVLDSAALGLAMARLGLGYAPLQAAAKFFVQKAPGYLFVATKDPLLLLLGELDGSLPGRRQQEFRNPKKVVLAGSARRHGVDLQA